MSEKLNILFVVSSFPTVTETFITNQIVYLLNEGHNVNILSFKKKNGVIHPVIQDNDLIEKTVFVNHSLSSRIKLLKDFFSFRDLKKKKRLLPAFNFFTSHPQEVFFLRSLAALHAISLFNLQFDIVHAHYGFNSELFFRFKNSFWLKNSELLTTFHGHDMKPLEIKNNRKRYKKLFDRNKKLTTNNKYAVSLLRRIRKDYSNIEVLPVSLDTNYFRKSNPNVKKNKNVVLFCGRLIRLKGPSQVIEIANHLIKEIGFTDVEFVLIGKGPQEQEIVNKIKELGLGDYVNLKGALDQSEVKKEMEEAKIFLLPGITDDSQRAENQGLVIQEAQAMELPVVVSSAGGMKYGLVSGKTGYVLPEGNIPLFSETIKTLLVDSEKADQMGKAGRDYVINNYDWNILGEKLLEIYYKLKDNDI